MRAMKEAYEVFGMYGVGGGYVKELQMLMQAMQFDLDQEDIEDLAETLKASEQNGQMPPYEMFVKAMGPYLVTQQRAEKLRNIIAPEMSHPLAQLGAILAAKKLEKSSFDTYS